MRTPCAAPASKNADPGAGDLHVHIKVLPHPFFTRDGADIHCEVPVQFPQAALGAQIDVPTLDGKVTMRVPPGTQSGKSFRLRGKGLPAFGGYGKGDQFVTLIIEVPQQVTEKQRALLEALAAEMNTPIQLPRPTLPRQAENTLDRCTLAAIETTAVLRAPAPHERRLALQALRLRSGGGAHMPWAAIAERDPRLRRALLARLRRRPRLHWARNERGGTTSRSALSA